MVNYIERNPKQYHKEVDGYLKQKKEMINKQEWLRKEIESPSSNLPGLSEEEYSKLETPGHKVLFYYRFIYNLISSCCADKHYHDELSLRIAFLLYHSIESASDELPYAKFPDILDAEKNPIINAVEKKIVSVSKNEDDEYLKKNEFLNLIGMELLAAFCGKKSRRDLNAEFPFEYLESATEDGKVSSRYKIQRDIIALFCSNKPEDLHDGETWQPFIIKEDF